ncbi:MAG: alpha/beta fold hydrolase [Bacteroidia bacterium]
MKKEPILFIHGALASKSQFSQVIALLNEQFDCHAINLPGHGGELIPTAGLTFDGFSQAILTYLDQHQIEQTHLFGFSMGGYASLYFAHKYPNRVKQIFTLNIKFNWDPITTAKETGFLDPDKMMEKIPAFANNLMVLHGMNIWKNLLASTSDMMKKLAETIVMSEEELKQIQHPVLLGIGDRDQTSSISETIKVYQLLSNARLWVVPNAAHPFEKINPERIAAEIRYFFLSA